MRTSSKLQFYRLAIVYTAIIGFTLSCVLLATYFIALGSHYAVLVLLDNYGEFWPEVCLIACGLCSSVVALWVSCQLLSHDLELTETKR